MGLGWALVKAANTGGGSALHGPAVAFVFGASIQGLKRIAWAASDVFKVRSSGLCLLMQAGVSSGPKLRLIPIGLRSRRDTWDAAVSSWMQLRSGLSAAF